MLQRAVARCTRSSPRSFLSLLPSSLENLQATFMSTTSDETAVPSGSAADPSKHVTVTATALRQPQFFDALVVSRALASSTVVQLEFEVGPRSSTTQQRSEDRPTANAMDRTDPSGASGDDGSTTDNNAGAPATTDTLQVARSPTVDDTSRFSFKPGQWVDLFIPAINAVGGFSMTSSCFAAGTREGRPGRMSLAIKDSPHPPARFMFERAQPGDIFPVRAGGDVYVEPADLGKRSIVLIAGGIGITPLHSILSSVMEALQQHQKKDDGRSSNAAPSQRIALVHSAGCVEELIFRPGVLEMAAAYPDTLLAIYHVTRGSRTSGEDQGTQVAEGASPCDEVKARTRSEAIRHNRIDRDSLATALAFASTTPEDAAQVSSAEKPDCTGSSDPSGTGGGFTLPPLVFLCGPPAFSEALEQLLTAELGVRPEDLRMEKWW